MKKKIKNYATVFTGLLMVALAYNIFLLPNNIVAGGISGLAMLYSDIYNIDISLFVLICNILLVCASFAVLGKKVTTKTIIGSLLLPILLKVTLPLTNYIDVTKTEIIIQALFGGVLTGYGFGLVFKQGYTSGGTDIINQIISKTFKIPISTSILLVDGYIVILGGLVFGIEKMIYAIITVLLISIYSNKSMTGIGDNKTFYIYTHKPKLVKKYLLESTKNDVTILNGEGGYTDKKIKIIMSVISTNEYYKVKQGILNIDPKAFIIVNESYELVNSNRKIRKEHNVA